MDAYVILRQMRSDLHEKLLDEVAKLRELISSCPTEEVVGRCSAYWLAWSPDSPRREKGLLSPAKQWPFLIGLMLGTPEPQTPVLFDKRIFSHAENLLNSIFAAYASDYFAGPDEKTDEKWFATRAVVMPAFLAFHQQPLLATTHQIDDRIVRYATPFDDRLKADLGISATETLEICRWVTDRLQGASDELSATTHQEKELRLALLARAKIEDWDRDRLRVEVNKPPYRDCFDTLQDQLLNLMHVRVKDLKSEFGQDLAATFWSLFSVSRGDIGTLTYPTEANPLEDRSLFVVGPGDAMCPLVNQMFLAALHRFESHLSSAEYRDSYFRKRDKLFEQEVQNQFRLLLGNSATMHPQVFETPDLHNEHDLMIQLGSRLFVVEAKASPPVEPFRDPDRAYKRIRQAFSKENGIQGAFDQALRIWTRLEAGDIVKLYDKDGSAALILDPAEVEEVFLICVTRDSFGPLAVDLEPLLEKSPNEPFPWCVNVLDLQAVADIWDYFGWREQEFLDFLKRRITLHGRILASDELEVVGFFIEHGGLHWLDQGEYDKMHFNPHYSDVFSRVYYARLGGDAVTITPHPPAMADVGKSFALGAPVPYTPNKSIVKKQGRNQLCNCGSGRKFKRCCGSN